MTPDPRPSQRHASPHLGAVAIIFTILFCASVAVVSGSAGRQPFPHPSASPDTISAFFRQRPGAALACAFLQLGAAIPLGIFTATIVSRLQFLGFRVAGVTIAIFGGFAAAFAVAANGVLVWAMLQPAVAPNPPLVTAMYDVGFAVDGPGYAMALGLLLAGCSVPLLIGRLVPRWIPILGLILAACGELSWLSLIFPQAMPLIPLTRFPGFVWMIAAGFAIPARRPASLTPQGA